MRFKTKKQTTMVSRRDFLQIGPLDAKYYHIEYINLIF